ncbi:hypothetical protein [Streptomyces solincola]|uniref:hypothetical protein n=1 Tax=Streptomyces solincola TaxID=2100817 RepID=UPI0011B1F0F7|nr:hypothetical protein [Streptomyces solincola]
MSQRYVPPALLSAAWAAAVAGTAPPPPPLPSSKLKHDSHFHVFGTLYGCDACEELCFCVQTKAAYGKDIVCVFCEAQ